MGRLIDADVLKQDLTRFYDNEVTAKKLIDEQPTVDAQAEIDRLNRLGLTWYDTILKLMEMVNGTEKVTRCKDCKWCRVFYHGPDMRLTYECAKLYLTRTEANDFCSKAERKE